MNEEELDPYEKEVKRATDEYNKRLKQKDTYESGLKKAKEEETKRIEDKKVEEEEGGFLDEGSAFRTTAAIGTEIAANTLLDLFSFIPPAQYAGGAAINYFAQRIRGGEFSQGEMIASGLASLLPGGAQAKSIGGVIGKGVARGALSGAIETGAADLIDTGELDAERIGQGALVGGAFGGIFSHIGSQKKVQRGIKYFQDRIKGEKFVKLSPEDALELGLGQPMMSVDPKDVPKTQQGMWMTPGRQAKPLAAKFFDDAGWREGRLNLKSWREAPGDGKAIAELFLTAQGKGVVFQTEASKQNSFMSRVFGVEGAKQLLGLPEEAGNIFQAHHKTATKAVLTGQEGLVYDSPYYHEIQKVWEDLELTLGNNPDNIIGTLGLVQRDLDSPHSLIHKFLDSKMGPDGTDFWTPERMNQIVIYDNDGNAIGHKNFELRKEWTKKQALIFKDAVDLLKFSHEQYYLAKGVRAKDYLTSEPILDEEIVDAFINKLPPKEGTGEYNTKIISKIAREVAEETNVTPTVKPSIQDVFDKQSKEIFDEMYKFAVNEANGEDMLLDVLFEGLTARQAINKWRKNDPQMKQLSIRFKKAIKQAKSGEGFKKLKELYQIKQGEIPPADTTFDKGAD